MEVRHIASLLAILLVSGHVTSFSVRRKSDRSADLSDALSILQRQRRRVSSDDMLGSERLLESRPLTLDDVSDWLGRDDESDGYNSDWMSDSGNFKNFDDQSYFSPYDIQNILYRQSKPEAELASQSELDDIFSDENDGGEEENTNRAPAKKKKEEMVSVKGEKRAVKKSTIPSDDDLSLDTLTKDEFKALMKAVEKLQRQADRLSKKSTPVIGPNEVKETILDSIPVEDNIAMSSEPVSAEELESVFDDEMGPVVKQTKVTEEAVPGPNGETVIERHEETHTEPLDEEADEALKDAIASEIEKGISEEEQVAEDIFEDLGNLKDDDTPENLDSMENYWLMNSYMNKDAPQKRTAKRAVMLPERLINEANEALEIALNQRNQRLEEEEAEEALEEAEAEAEEEAEEDQDESASALVKTPSVDVFLKKIVQLQSEVNRLKMVARLEDLENDVLTDALNEATLGQKEGTVSNLEFDSLQQAIRLEEALQELKASPESGKDGIRSDSNDVIKRGEPWRRKRRPEAGSHTGSSGGLKFNMADIESLLDQTYRKEDSLEESRDSNEVASLFLKDPETCPAVREYSTNCELADLYSLPVDYEARALCNLHQMCYSCGYSLHVAQDHCDFVYRAASAALCEEKDSCVVESEVFLRTMKLKTRYVPHNQPYCRSTCMARFLGML